jgi:hypothetical protein
LEGASEINHELHATIKRYTKLKVKSRPKMKARSIMSASSKGFKSSSSRRNEARHSGHDNGRRNRTYIIEDSRVSHFMQIPESRNTEAQPANNLQQNSHI